MPATPIPWLLVLGFPLLAGYFGWSALARFSSLDPDERFAASWGVGFAFLGMTGFLGFALHADPLPWALATFAVMLLLATLSRPWRHLFPWRFAVLFALSYLQLVCVQAVLDNYRGSNWYFDWWMHYDEALIFLGDRPVTTQWGPYTLASRTPLFNLTAASVMALAGHDFATYQLATCLVSAAVVTAVALLARDFFGRPACLLALLLGPLNLWLLHNAWFTWPKMLAGYYLVLGLHFHVRSLRLRSSDPSAASTPFLCFWLSAILGFLTHQVAAVYGAPLLLHAAWLAARDPIYRPSWREWLAFGLVALLLVAPWYGWLLANLGAESVVGSTPVTHGDESARFTPLAILSWVGHNTFMSLVPDRLLAAPAQPAPFVATYQGLTELYFSLIPGALTLSLCAFLAGSLVVGLVRTVRARKIPTWPPADWPARTAVLLFALAGYLGAAVLHPGKIGHGIAHSAAFPTVLVLLAVSWGLLSRAPTWAFVLVGCGMAAEFLLMFWSHYALLVHAPQVLEDLPGNDAYRDDTIVFLCERLGAGQYLFLAGLVLIQAVVVVLLFRTRSANAAGSNTNSPNSVAN